MTELCVLMSADYSNFELIHFEVITIDKEMH